MTTRCIVTQGTHLSRIVPPSSKVLAAGLQNCLAVTWQTDDTFSDFDVIVDGATFRCHKYLLHATSGFFAALFRSGMKETAENRVELKMMSKEVFGVIAKAIYTGEPGLTRENFMDVWQASSMLDIQYLSDECQKFAMLVIDEENCVEVYNFAKRMCFTKMALDARSLMLFRFERVAQTEGFLQNMTYSLFLDLLENRFLNASNEDVVVDSILRWVRYEPDSVACETLQGFSDLDNRVRHLPLLLRSTRMFLISEACLKRMEEFTQDIPECHDTIREALLFTRKKDVNWHAWQKSSTHRPYSWSRNAVVIMTSNQLLAFRLLHPRKLSTISKIPRRSSLVFRNMCVFKNKIYMDQRGFSFSSLTTLDDKDSTEELIFQEESYRFDLTPKLCNTKLLSHNGCLYRYYMGAVYSLVKNQDGTNVWAEVFRSEDIESASEVISFENFILFFTTVKQATIVFGLDTETGVCRRMSDLAGGALSLVAFNDCSNTYILQRNGALHKLILQDGSQVCFELVAKLWDVEWHPLLAVTFCEKLYIFGKDYLLPVDANLMNRRVPPGSFSFKGVEIIKEDDALQCCPMILPKFWFH